MSESSNLIVINHPVIHDRLAIIRDKNTNTQDFKQAMTQIAQLMAFSITQTLKTTDTKIHTPIEETSCQILEKGDPIIIPILRAGLGLSDGMAQILTKSPIGHIGLNRDEETKKPKEYLVKLPPSLLEKEILLVDPMLATGHSALYAIDILIEKGVAVGDLTLVILIASLAGVKAIHDKYPNLKIFTAALDDKLNENAYIVPGLGDAGDRMFGT